MISGTLKNLSSSSICGDNVVNLQGDGLGKIEDLMIDLESGRVAYAVLSFGGFLGMNNKLFAIPFTALKCDGESDKHQFVLNVSKEALKNAPGFDKDNWPDTADRKWGESIHSHYGVTPYWSTGQ